MGTETETRIRYSVAGSYIDRLMTHLPTQEWPEVKVINDEPIVLDHSFKQALWEALECCSGDSSRYVLNGACLDTRGQEGHYIVGTDGRHLFAANTFHFTLREPLIVPGRKFISWPGFMNDGSWKLRVLPAIRPQKEDPKGEPKQQGPWFQIESDRWSYLARAIDGEFPNWKQAASINTENWTRVTLQQSSIDMMLNTVPLLPGGDESDHGITLLAGNGLVLKAKGQDQTDWTSVTVPDTSVVGKAVQVSINRAYLTKALRFGLGRIEMNDPLSPVVFCNPAKTMVVMPLRMDTPPIEPAPVQEPEPSSPAPPSAVEVANNPTVERKIIMTTNSAPETTTAPERGNLRVHPRNTPRAETDSRSAFKTAIESLDRIKTDLRDVIGDLTDLGCLLKAAEKEQKSSAKEIEAVRAKLREIRSVEI
jgi:DNA polymerase III sliding clamp (beta) subunit (PCNA family)